MGLLLREGGEERGREGMEGEGEGKESEEKEGRREEELHPPMFTSRYNATVVRTQKPACACE